MQIAIMGGGINGLYLAWKLANMGNKVDVYERKEEIGNKACSGLFSERILDYIPQSKSLVLNKINSAIVNFPKKQLKLHFKKHFLVVSHFELDRMVAGFAKEAGAKIILNANIEKMPDGYDRIIGCDGPLSVTRKALGLKSPGYKLGMLGFSKDSSTESFVETWPIKNGFIWRIPRRENTEYGIMAEIENAKSVFEEFIKRKGIKLQEMQSKIIPNGLILPDSGNTTLCGDAAGLTKPWSGGGVIWQLELANLIIKTFPDFNEYCREARKVFKLKLKGARLATSLVYFFGFNMPFLLPKEYLMDNDSLSFSNHNRRK